MDRSELRSRSQTWEDGVRSRLVTLSEIAKLAGVKPTAVSNWRARHPDTFPRPVHDDLFDLEEVRAWLGTRGSARGAVDRFLGAPDRHVDPAPMLMSRSVVGKRRSPAVEERLDPREGMLRWVRVGAPAERDERLGVVLALLALRVLAPGALASPLKGARRLEADGRVPSGALSGPLSFLQGVPRGQVAELRSRVLESAESAGPAVVFEDLLSLRDGRAARAAGGRAEGSRRFDHVAELVPSGRAAETVVDPFCRTGDYLVAVNTHLPHIQRLIGYTADDDDWALCVQRMIVHRFDADIRKGLLPADNRTPDAGADLIVTEPPKWILRGATPRAVWESLAPDGVAFVVADRQSLFSTSQRSSRSQLVRTGTLVAVVALPSDRDGSSVLLVMRRPGSRPTPALIVDRTAIPPMQRDVAGVLRRWLDDPHPAAVDAEWAVVVDPVDLLASEVDLRPERWMRPVMAGGPSGGIHNGLKEAESLMARLIESSSVVNRNSEAIRRTVRAGEENGLSRAGLRAPEGVPPPVSLQMMQDEGVVEVIRARDVGPALRVKSKRHVHPYVKTTRRDADGSFRAVGYVPDGDDVKLTRPGDVILEPGQRAAVDDVGGHAVGPELWVVRPRSSDPRYDPFLLAVLLGAEDTALSSSTATEAGRRPTPRTPRDVVLPQMNLATAAACAPLAKEYLKVRDLTQSTSDAALAMMSDGEDAVSKLGMVLRVGAIVGEPEG